MLKSTTSRLQWFFSHHTNPLILCLDLAFYLSVMFSIRSIYFEQVTFITNGLFWSFSTLLTAILLMKLRGITFKDLGLFTPQSINKALFATVFIFLFTVISIMLFELFKDQLAWQLGADRSEQNASAKFGELVGNWRLFFMILPFIWLQSTLEEVLDRGFLMNWIDKALSSTWFATVFALIAQACIFGFRHSYDFSERSITVGLIGLAMGLGYLCFGRNLWPLIFAHCALNTMSMLDRV